MVLPIEEQMLEHLISLEEERCKKLEQEYKNDPKKRNKKEKRRKINKPWTRPSPSTLCQEPELLLMIKDYDYDMSNKSFQEYCRERGVLNVAGEKGTKLWKYMQDYSMTEKHYRNDPYFQYAEEFNRKNYKYSSDEMNIGWEIIKIGRAKLQDCWEIYRNSLR